jgi:hypothetical protein
MTKIALSAAGAVALAASAGVPAIAQNSHQDLVNSLLDAAEGLARNSGYNSTHSRYNGQLSEGQEKQVTIDLDAGTSYMIIAQCDGDCSDIDLWLYDENNNLIDEDVLEDDTPIVQVTPIRNARFRIRARMITCNVEPCYYGIGVYGQ